MAYDDLRDRHGSRANKENLKIPYLAAKESESGVIDAIRWLMDHGQLISFDVTETMVISNRRITQATDVVMEAVDLSHYSSAGTIISLSLNL